MNLEHIKKVDTLVAEQTEKEFERQQNTIELIASENITSQAVMEACGSVLTNKYAEGKPHKRFYNGAIVLTLLKKRLKKEHANFSIWIMPMFNLTVAHKPTWQYLWRCLNPVTKF